MSLKSAVQAFAAAMLAAFALWRRRAAAEPDGRRAGQDAERLPLRYTDIARSRRALSARRWPNPRSAAGSSTSPSWMGAANLVAFARMDGAQLASIAISEHRRARGDVPPGDQGVRSGVSGREQLPHHPGRCDRFPRGHPASGSGN